MRLIGVACNYQKPHKLTAPVFLISKLYTYKSVKVVQANWATSVLPSHLLQLHEKAITAFKDRRHKGNALQDSIHAVFE